MYQAKLQRGTETTTGWIPAKGAVVGRNIELLPAHTWWKVVEVYTHGMPEETVKANQQLNRKSLPSVKPIT